MPTKPRTSSGRWSRFFDPKRDCSGRNRFSWKYPPGVHPGCARGGIPRCGGTLRREKDTKRFRKLLEPARHFRRDHREIPRIPFLPRSQEGSVHPSEPVKQRSEVQTETCRSVHSWGRESARLGRGDGPGIPRESRKPYSSVSSGSSIKSIPICQGLGLASRA